MTELQNSIIAWLNVSDLSEHINELADIADGILLTELMNQAAPKYFDPSKLSRDESWAHKLTNLKELMLNLDLYFGEQLHIKVEAIQDDINLSAIARNYDRGEILKLMELIIGAAVSCDQKETYVNRIMRLSENNQAELMFFIQKVLDKWEGDEEPEKPVIVEQQVLRRENRRLGFALTDMQQDMLQMELQLRQLANEREDLIINAEEAEQELRIARSPRNKNVNNEIVQELDEKLRDKDKEINRLNTTLTQERLDHQVKIDQLKDEMDVQSETILDLGLQVGQMNVYKKRIEELNDHQLRNKDLKEKIQMLQEKLRDKDEESVDMAKMSDKLSFYKDKLGAEKEQVATLTVKSEQLEIRVKKMEQENSDLQKKLSFTSNKNQDLEKEIEELMNKSDVSSFGEDSFTNAFKDDNQVIIRKLEEENVALRTQRRSTLLDDLNTQVTELMALRASAENEKSMAEKGKEELVEELRRKQSQIDDFARILSMGKQETNRIKEELKEFTALKQANEDINKEKAQLLSDIHALYQKSDENQSKFMQSQEQLFSTQRELKDKDIDIRDKQLEINTMTQELKDLQKRPAEDGSKIQLEKQILEQKTLISQLNLTLRQKEDEIVVIKSERDNIDQASQLPVGSSNMEVQRMKMKLMEKDQEIGYLNKAKDELDLARQREIRLITTVLHEVGMDLCRINSNSI